MAAALLLSSFSRGGPAQPAQRAGTSVASLLALLHESEPALQEHALRRLSGVVDTAWAEVAEEVSRIEAIAEDSSSAHATTAALIASKVYYHLEAYPEALRLALAAGKDFNVADRSAYTQTILARIIDAYSAARATTPPAAVDPRVVSAVDRMFDVCVRDRQLKVALGVAIECKRLDVVERVLAAAAEIGVDADMLLHAFSVAQSVVSDVAFRREIVRVVANAHKGKVQELLRSPQDLQGASALSSLANSALPLARCLQTLDAAPQVAELIMDLLRAAAASTTRAATGRSAVPVALLLAYQVAFDAVESENQTFLLAVHKALPSTVAEGDDTYIVHPDESTPAESSASSSAPGDAAAPRAQPAMRLSAAIANVQRILTGTSVGDIYCDVLSSKCSADPLLLKNIKTATDAPRNSVLHHAVVVAHGYMYAGTGIDSFLRTNLEWLGRANNWAKFSASASQGVVHKGRLRDSMTILEAYLPAEGQATASPYSEGGALYALGLIHANRGASASAASTGAAAGAASGGSDVISYLANALRNTRDEVLQHGACLGLGAAAMGTGDDTLYTNMRDAMFQENAVVGEGAAIGIGLLLAGRGGQWVSESSGEAAATEMLAHAHDTAHEKTIRGIAMALALMCYGKENQADVLIGQLVRDKDAVLRYGGMYAIGLAYVGTANNTAVRQLLHVAVSDVSDDVRRAAVTNIGFVLARAPAEVAVFVAQLAESYNPHVRYGAAMAVGIACAGSGLPEAVGLLEPLLDDPVDFVRQAALLSLGLVLQQETEKHLPKAKVIRDKFMSIIKDRHQPTMTKMGAILASGLVDAAGRNGVVSMISRGGFIKTASVIGVALWLQYWYWFPLLHFLSLAITPTASIGICDDLGSIAGDFKLDVTCPPSWFAYPEHLVEEKKDKTAGVTTTELSITAKAKAKAAAKAKDKEKQGGAAETKMDIDESKPAPSAAAGAAAATTSEVTMAEGAAAAEPTKEKEEKKDEKEPSSYSVTNPARITYAQAKFVRVPAGQRYIPVRQDLVRGTGITVLLDTTPAVADASRRPIKVPAIGEEGAGPEPSAPEAFEWTPGEYM